MIGLSIVIASTAKQSMVRQAHHELHPELVEGWIAHEVVPQSGARTVIGRPRDDNKKNCSVTDNLNIFKITSFAHLRWTFRFEGNANNLPIASKHVFPLFPKNAVCPQLF